MGEWPGTRGGNYGVAVLIDKLPGPTGLGDVYPFCRRWRGQYFATSGSSETRRLRWTDSEYCAPAVLHRPTRAATTRALQMAYLSQRSSPCARFQNFANRVHFSTTNFTFAAAKIAGFNKGKINFAATKPSPRVLGQRQTQEKTVTQTVCSL